MRYTAVIAIALGVSTLGACGGTPQQERAEKVEAAAENKAAAIEQNAADAPPAVREEAEFNAGLTREAGEIQAEAIRDSEGKVPDTQ
jgi:FKBP-type peptidyl-prolyl cis-trans isomerase